MLEVDFYYNKAKIEEEEEVTNIINVLKKSILNIISAIYININSLAIVI